jgi:hypothetical protein
MPEPLKNEFVRLLLDSGTGYAQLRMKASQRSILEILSIAQLYEPARIREMVTAISNANQPGQIFNQQPFFRPFLLLPKHFRGC